MTLVACKSLDISCEALLFGSTKTYLTAAASLTWPLLIALALFKYTFQNQNQNENQNQNQNQLVHPMIGPGHLSDLVLRSPLGSQSIHLSPLVLAGICNGYIGLVKDPEPFLVIIYLAILFWCLSSFLAWEICHLCLLIPGTNTAYVIQRIQAFVSIFIYGIGFCYFGVFLIEMKNIALPFGQLGLFWSIITLLRRGYILYFHHPAPIQAGYMSHAGWTVLIHFLFLFFSIYWMSVESMCTNGDAPWLKYIPGQAMWHLLMTPAAILSMLS